jgi:hypothetical protein
MSLANTYCSQTASWKHFALDLTPRDREAAPN